MCSVLTLFGLVLFLKYKDNSEALFKGESPEDDTLDVSPESMKSEALSSPEKSFDCHSKGEQGTHLPTDDVRSIEDTMQR